MGEARSPRVNPTGSSGQKPDAASGRPRDWYPCCNASGKNLIRDELVAVVLFNDGREVTQSEKEVRVAELKATLGRAARGELREESWKAVSREPELWELRWQWGDGSQVRGYFHEPLLEPGSTILAKMHLKEIDLNDSKETRRRQNIQIDAAAVRIRGSKDQRWGLDQSQRLV